MTSDLFFVFLILQLVILSAMFDYLPVTVFLCLIIDNIVWITFWSILLCVSKLCFWILNPRHLGHHYRILYQ